MIELPNGTVLGVQSIPGRDNFNQNRPPAKEVIQITVPGGPNGGNPPVQDSQYYWNGTTTSPLANVNIDWADLSIKDKKWWTSQAKVRYGGDPRYVQWAPGFFADAVSMSAQYYANNQQVTPQEAAKKFLELQKQAGSGSSSGGGGGGGSATPTVSAQNMHRLVDQTTQQFLGREATNAEAKAFTKDVRQSLSSNPKNTDPTFMAEEFAKNTPEATTYAANNYMKVFLQSLGGLGG